MKILFYLLGSDTNSPLSDVRDYFELNSGQIQASRGDEKILESTAWITATRGIFVSAEIFAGLSLFVKNNIKRFLDNQGKLVIFSETIDTVCIKQFDVNATEIRAKEKNVCSDTQQFAFQTKFKSHNGTISFFTLKKTKADIESAIKHIFKYSDVILFQTNKDIGSLDQTIHLFSNTDDNSECKSVFDKLCIISQYDRQENVLHFSCEDGFQICMTLQNPDPSLFDHKAFFENAYTDFAPVSAFAHSVTSTQTLLEKYPSLRNNLPHGFTLVSYFQTAGRGRGTNKWFSSTRGLAMTVLLHEHVVTKLEKATFLQYVSALSITQAIKSMYRDLEIAIKWPNDIYIAVPPQFPESQDIISFKKDNKRFYKISGVLINAIPHKETFRYLIGIGLNVNNEPPVASIANVRKLLLQEESNISIAVLAGKIRNFLQVNIAKLTFGKIEDLMSEYYKYWLHDGAKVTLGDASGSQITIVGVDHNSGQLKAKEVDTGHEILIHPDGNTFDIMKGMIRSKYGSDHVPIAKSIKLVK